MNDIQEIEGIGPMLVLATWPRVLRHSLWSHFLANNGALSCLVKGGSRAVGTDTLVGMTWHMVSKLSTLPWFERVDSKSNPVDGLSRKVVAGPWRLVDLVFPGGMLRREMRRAARLV